MSAQDLMRQRFHELRDEIAAIEAVSAPLRDQRDAIIAQAQAIEAKTAPLTVQIIEAENGLYDKKNELAMLSRALRGNTAVA